MRSLVRKEIEALYFDDVLKDSYANRNIYQINGRFFNKLK